MKYLSAASVSKSSGASSMKQIENSQKIH